MGKAKKTNKKAVKKTKSQFYVVRTALEARDNLSDKVKDYNEKYVNHPFKAGQEFIEDVRKDPRKVYDGLVDDGLDFVKDVKKDAQKTVEDGKKLVKDLREDPRKVFDDFVEDAKGYVGDVRKDARKTVPGLLNPEPRTSEPGVTRHIACSSYPLYYSRFSHCVSVFRYPFCWADSVGMELLSGCC